MYGCMLQQHMQLQWIEATNVILVTYVTMFFRCEPAVLSVSTK